MNRIQFVNPVENDFIVALLMAQLPARNFSLAAGRRGGQSGFHGYDARWQL